MDNPEEIQIECIVTSADVLRDLDQDVVMDLARSIQQVGLLQPILVRSRQSTFEVVFGHHRLEACKRLGWKTIPAVVRKMSDDESFLTRVVENLHRNIEVNPVTEANGYIKLIEHGWTINRIAQQIGKSDSYVSDRIGLIRRLHPDIARRFNRAEAGKYLKPSHLEVLSRLKSKEKQLDFSCIVERKRLSVRRLERMIAGGCPVKETVVEKGNSLYVKLPPAIAMHVELGAGDSVYVYAQSRRRIAIESSNLR